MSDICRLTGNIGNKKISCEKHFVVKDFPIHWHEYYEIEYIQSGQGIYTINNTEYAVSPGTLVFLTPIDFSSLHADEGEMAILNISFSESWISDKIISDISTYSVINSYPSFLCEKIFDELKNEREYASSYIRFLLGCILIDAVRCAKSSEQASAKSNNVVSDMLSYVHTHFRDDPSLTELSAHVGLSPNYLSKLFHANVGKTYKAYVVGLKLNYAATMLTQTDTAVTDICYLCGFNSLAHFLRVFKEKYGMSPMKYRQMHKLNN